MHQRHVGSERCDGAIAGEVEPEGSSRNKHWVWITVFFGGGWRGTCLRLCFSLCCVDALLLLLLLLLFCAQHARVCQHCLLQLCCNSAGEAACTVQVNIRTRAHAHKHATIKHHDPCTHHHRHYHHHHRHCRHVTILRTCDPAFRGFERRQQTVTRARFSNWVSCCCRVTPR